MTTWTNSDGLQIEFGTTRANASTGGEPDQAGEVRKLVVDIDLTTLADANAAVGFVDRHELPKGAIIKSATTTVLTAAASGGAAVLDLGLIKVGTAGTDDDDGLDAAIALAALTPKGAEVAGDGALVGTALDAAYHVAASFDTAAYTAGKVRLTIQYIPTLNREDQ